MPPLGRQPAEEVVLSQSQKAILRRSGGILIRGHNTWVISDLELDKLVAAWSESKLRPRRSRR